MTPTPETLSKRMTHYEAVRGTEMLGSVRCLSVETTEFCDWLNAVVRLEASEQARQRAETLLREFPCPIGSVVNVNALLTWNARRGAALAAGKEKP